MALSWLRGVLLCESDSVEEYSNVNHDTWEASEEENPKRDCDEPRMPSMKRAEFICAERRRSKAEQSRIRRIQELESERDEALRIQQLAAKKSGRTERYQDSWRRPSPIKASSRKQQS